MALYDIKEITPLAFPSPYMGLSRKRIDLKLPQKKVSKTGEFSKNCIISWEETGLFHRFSFYRLFMVFFRY
jgi:hypothetical protein